MARLLVISAAYPSATEPCRAIFLETLHRELIDVSGGAAGITVVAPRVHRGDPSRERRAGVTVERFRYPSGGRRLKESRRVPVVAVILWLLAAALRAWRVGRRDRAEVVIAHWLLPTGLAAAVVAGALGVPLVLWAHGSDVHRFAERSRLAATLAGWAARRAERVFAVSGPLHDFLRDRLRVAADRLAILPMGVDEVFAPGDRAAAREAIGLEREGPLGLFVGDLTEEKGVGDLLLAAEALAKRWDRGDRPPRPLTLALVGEGPLAEAIGPLATPRALGEGASVRLLRVGRVAPPDLVAWYRAADWLVFPSRSEGAPLVVLEALACGLPVLASRVGGIPEQVDDGVTGMLVDAGGPRRLARSLDRLLHAPERVAAMREALRRRSPPATARRRAEELWSEVGVLLARRAEAPRPGGQGGGSK